MSIKKVMLVTGAGDSWTCKTFFSSGGMQESYLSPNRREFYQIMLVTGGAGRLTIGGNTYSIKRPVMLFVRPHEIISWKNLSIQAGAHYALFKKAFMIRYPQFKAMLDTSGLFRDRQKTVICLNNSRLRTCCRYFEKMEAEDRSGNVYREDIIQALLQLLVVESIQAARFLTPGTAVPDPPICQFFELLEKETAGISFTNPIRIRTAKEFANNLHIHPNYLNRLSKKQTGQSVSTHIRNRLLEEAKMLLLQTNWPLQDIAYSIGFSEQSNFQLFFKKNTGFTPAGFRRGFN
ncbi:AraC family transcriptional regulator [Chitinophaga agrisoli]|nr:AraC family transcriptional regulator [Chitinophaga agrisoli]